MSLEVEEECPECGESSFWLSASTLVKLGTKQKYSCSNCEYGFVRIDGTVDTSQA